MVRKLVGLTSLFNLAPVRISARLGEVPLEISVKLSGLFAAVTALHSAVVPSNPERSKDFRLYYSSVTYEDMIDRRSCTQNLTSREIKA